MNFKSKKSYFIIIILLTGLILNSESAIDLYKKGKDAYFYEDYYTAINYFKRSLELNPNYLDPIQELAHLYYDIENYDYAYNYINKAIKLSTNTDKLIIFSADIETELGLYDLAEKNYKAILQKDPINIEAQNGLAKLYIKTNKFILAKKILDNVLKSDPNNFQSIYLSAQYYQNTNLEKSESYYLMNIQRNSLNPDSYFYYSLFNFKNKNILKAIENIKTAMNIKDKLKYKKYYGKYLLFVNQGNEAVKVFKDIIRSEKNNYLNHYFLAVAYYMVSDIESAIRSLKIALNLRDDDEVSEYFLNNIFIDNFEVDDKNRIERADYFYNKALNAKKESEFSLFVYYLKEAIRLYPKNVNARIELAEYFLLLKLPERYLRELQVASKYSNNQSIIDRLKIEKKRITYRLGDNWNIDQYSVKTDLFYIPVFANKNIQNNHYNVENIFLNVFKNIFSNDRKYEINIYDDKDYQANEKMNICKTNDSPFYLDLDMIENESSVNISLKLFNSSNNELIKEYKIIKNGNKRLLKSALDIYNKINQDILFKSHIIKISKNRAIINAGRQSGIKLKDVFVILKKRDYNLEFDRATFFYNSNDIKGYGVAVKVDENITELLFKDNDFADDIDVDDIVIYKK